MKGQNPIPDNVMRVYKQVLMNGRDGWKVVTYATDSYGRFWHTRSAVEAPELGLGQQLRPEEMADAEA